MKANRLVSDVRICSICKSTSPKPNAGGNGGLSSEQSGWTTGQHGTCNGLLSRASRKQQLRIRLQNKNKRSSRSICLTRLESDLVQQQHVTATTIFWQQPKSQHWQKSLAFWHAALGSLLDAGCWLLAAII